MSSIVVLQARTNSSRLPGKVLLPIKGLPLAILAAKRASNTGRDIIVVTSIEASDDYLASIIQDYGLRCYRGSLENALDRIVNALFEYDDQSIVFRLTADNVFPDGPLLDELEQEFLKKGFEYLCCNGENSGLPYGVSVEITRLGHLREAARESKSLYEQEHVTPYIIKKFGLIYFQKYREMKKGHFRCTIDCLDDYITIQKVFSDVRDPVRESSFRLMNLLEKAPFQPFVNSPTAKLVLGTAQFGGGYGIANTAGQPDVKECQKLIKTAITNGTIYLDTARAYGSSEEIVGLSLANGWEGRVKIITKLSPLNDCPKKASNTMVHALVDASIFKSCLSLRVKKIDVLMLHRISHLSKWQGSAWHRLMELQSSGIIGELGASVQDPDELSRALEKTEISYIQLPFNILDWRWDSIIAEILEVKSLRKLTIHVRSVFLQGLLPSINVEHWQRANVTHSLYVREWLAKKVTNYSRRNVIDLCLSYVNALGWIDGITIGIDNIIQLTENIDYFTLPPLSLKQVHEIKETRPILSEETLNPACWKEVNS